ncbi:hypothetical protein YPPY90_0517, partial [Yersinia pestis PY-90]
MAFFGDP